MGEFDFNKIPLSKTTKFIVDNRGKTAPTKSTGIPLIATNCVNSKNLYPSYLNLRYVSQETYDNWFRSHPQPGDILLTLKGSQNGAVCLVPKPVDFVIAQDMVALRADEKIIDPLFLFAALRSPSIKNQIENLDVSGVIPHLKKTDFDKLFLPYPESSIQKEIGNIYYNFCRKINLLHRQNKTLEQMAETLFRQWFVEKAEEDWEWHELGEFIEVLRGLSYKGAGLSDEKNGIPMHNLNSVYEGGGYKYEGIKYYSGQYKDRHLINSGEIIITNTEQGHDMLLIGYPAIIPKSFGKNGIFSQHVFKLIIKNDYITTLYLYYLLMSHDVREQVAGSTNGSTVNMLPKDGVEWAKFKLPPKVMIDEFTSFAEPLLCKKEENITQICTLENLRDTLLPKLMSGEVRISSNG